MAVARGRIQAKELKLSFEIKVTYILMNVPNIPRIRQKVKEGALERLADRPGAKKKTVSLEQYEALKRDLEEKERALAELAVEVAILRKKNNGGSWER
jgi:hypothetical protein